VREIRGAKINPKSSFKNQGAQNTRGRKLREQILYSTFSGCFLSIIICIGDGCLEVLITLVSD